MDDPLLDFLRKLVACKIFHFLNIFITCVIEKTFEGKILYQYSIIVLYSKRIKPRTFKRSEFE